MAEEDDAVVRIISSSLRVMASHPNGTPSKNILRQKMKSFYAHKTKALESFEWRVLHSVLSTIIVYGNCTKNSKIQMGFYGEKLSNPFDMLCHPRRMAKNLFLINQKLLKNCLNGSLKE